MGQSTLKSGFVKGMSRLYFCVVLAMTAQMLLLLVWSFLGPESRLNGIMDSVYGSVARSIGTLFFEEQMFPGNIGLGLSLLFLTVMLYSVVIGTVFCLGYKLFVKRSAGKTAAEE